MGRRARNLRIGETIFLLSFVLSLSTCAAYAAAPELKPVLKPIDPSMAKLDTPEPEPAPQPKEDPAEKYNRAHPIPSCSYGMSGGGNNSYQPSVDPNDRRNQVFTPPWQQTQQQYQQPYQQQQQYQQPYQQPYQQQQYQQPYQQSYQQQQYQQPYQQPYQQQQYQQPYQQPYQQQQYQQPYQQPYQQQQYQQPYQQPYQQQQYQQPYRQPQQQQYQQPAGGFPSPDMIPDFNKPLPSGYSNKGAGGRWTAGPQPGTQMGPAGGPEARVERLEKLAFGTVYPEHDVEARLDHLEKEIFGSTSQGSVEQRLSRLEQKLGGQGAFQSNAGKVDNTAGGAGAASIVARIPYDKQAGDYFDKIKRFPGNTVARWTNFPVKVRLPQETPSEWKESLNEAIESWSRFVPLTLAERTEAADVEVSWVNHLNPRLLGVTRLTAFNGNLKVRIYLLRPTYYLEDLSENALGGIFQHELGHGLGLFGHSDRNGDTMYLTELSSEGKITNRNMKRPSERDLNTLRRIYETSPLPRGFSTPKPVEWS